MNPEKPLQKFVSALPNEHWIRAEEATAILERYPDATSDEITRLVTIYPHLPMLHIALMTSDDELRPRLEAFQTDHGRRIRTPFNQIRGLLLPLALLLIVLVWLILN